MQACISAFDGNKNICEEKAQLLLKMKNPQTLHELLKKGALKVDNLKRLHYTKTTY